MNGDGVGDVVMPNQVILGALTPSVFGAGNANFSAGDQLRHRDSRDYSVGFNGNAVTCTTKSGGLSIHCDNPDGPDRGTLGLGTGAGLGIGRAATNKDLVD